MFQSVFPIRTLFIGASLLLLTTGCKKDPEPTVTPQPSTPKSIGSWQIGTRTYTAKSFTRRNANSIVATGTSASGTPSSLTIFNIPLPTASTTLPIQEGTIGLTVPPTDAKSTSSLYESLETTAGNVVYTVTNGKLTIAISNALLYDYYSTGSQTDSALFSCMISEP